MSMVVTFNIPTERRTCGTQNKQEALQYWVSHHLAIYSFFFFFLPSPFFWSLWDCCPLRLLLHTTGSNTKLLWSAATLTKQQNLQTDVFIQPLIYEAVRVLLPPGASRNPPPRLPVVPDLPRCCWPWKYFVLWIKTPIAVLRTHLRLWKMRGGNLLLVLTPCLSRVSDQSGDRRQEHGVTERKRCRLRLLAGQKTNKKNPTQTHQWNETEFNIW